MMVSLAVMCLLLAHVYVVSSRCCSPPPTTPRPSRAPTYSPTRLPSTEPTRRPSRAPTPSPTRLPSVVPTRKPSRSPTIDPSASPSEEPTYAPSKPTSQPSSAPTTFTPRPSYQPSIEPSYKPSILPTNKPTATPTWFPTRMPSNTPTCKPTLTPTAEPTEYPTISMRPTALPSALPTMEPTISPTEVPSIMPSVAPSVNPSTVPSPQPTTSVAFALRMDISQVLVNIDATTFQNSSANFDAFSLAVSSTVDGLEPTDVNVTDVTDTTVRLRRYLRCSYSHTGVSASFMHVREVAPTVSVQYAVSFVVQERGFTDATQAAEHVQTQLRAAVGDGIFAASLASAAGNVSGADPALRNVTTGAISFLRTDVTILRSAAPTAQPTNTPGALGGASKSGFVGLGAGAQAGIIIAIIFGTVLLFVVLYLLLRRVECATAAMSKGSVLWYEVIRPRGHEKNPYRGEKKTTTATADTIGAETAADSDALAVGHIRRRNPTNLLFLSRHAAATEALMEELDSLFARLPVQADTGVSESTTDMEGHPLTTGFDVSTLPPVVFPEVREWSSLLKPPDPPRLLMIGRCCPATQHALFGIDYSLNAAGITLSNEAVEHPIEKPIQEHEGSPSNEEKEEEEEEVMHIGQVHLHPPPPLPVSRLPNSLFYTHGTHDTGAVNSNKNMVNGVFNYVDALSVMILNNRNIDACEQQARQEAPSPPPPPPPSISPSTVRTEFTEYSESSALFADCLDGPPRVPSTVAAAAQTTATDGTTQPVALPQPDTADTTHVTDRTVIGPASLKLPEVDADIHNDTVDQVRIVSSRRARSPRSPTLFTAKGSNSAFVRPKAI